MRSSPFFALQFRKAEVSAPHLPLTQFISWASKKARTMRTLACMFWSARFSAAVPPWIRNRGIFPVMTWNRAENADTTLYREGKERRDVSHPIDNRESPASASPSIAACSFISLCKDDMRHSSSRSLRGGQEVPALHQPRCNGFCNGDGKDTAGKTSPPSSPLSLRSPHSFRLFQSQERIRLEKNKILKQTAAPVLNSHAESTPSGPNLQ